MKKHNQYLFFVSLAVVSVSYAASSSDDCGISLVPRQEVHCDLSPELKQKIHEALYGDSEPIPVPNMAGMVPRSRDLKIRDFDLRVVRREEAVSSSRSSESDGLEWSESDGGSSIAIHASEVPSVVRDKSEDGLNALLNTPPATRRLAALRKQFPAQQDLLKGASKSPHKVGVEVKG
jgi:hypothetical protein